MVNVLKLVLFWPKFCFFVQLFLMLFWPKFCFLYSYFLKILSGIANSVDPGQEEQSDQSLLCFLGRFCQKLWCTKF